MADAAMSTVVNKMTELAGQEVRLLLQVVKDVKSLTDKFEWLQALLNDADQQRRASNNPFVALWVRQARDTAFALEDVLDEFSWKVEKAKLSGYGNWKAVLKFRWATDWFTGIWVTHGLSSKIEDIKEKLQKLQDDKDTYNIELHPSSSSWSPSFNKKITTWSSQDSDAPVGLEEEMKNLIKLLTEDEEETKFISIIGNGSGRSMLAKRAYSSSEIQDHFEVVAWKNTPPNFRPHETFPDIVSKVLEQEGKEKENYEDEKLSALLKERRYLIVLNGIDNLEDWKNIMRTWNVFPDDKNGSRVVLIPRSGSEIARLSKIEGITPFKQKHSFTPEESWDLFCQKLSEKTSYPIKSYNCKHEVHKLTKGHPIAIVLLAGLLGSKEISDWSKVCEHLKASKEANPIDRMLSLSFDDLPHQLKSCFLYFAAVPQSAGIEANQLVRIWIAEGFIQPKNGRRMEEIGETYLKELISRSLVRIEEKDEFGSPAVVAVNSHIHSFLQSEAQESSFVDVHDNTDLVSPGKIRRLSIQNYTHKYVQINNIFPKLRSFLCDCLEVQTVETKQNRLSFLLKSKFLKENRLSFLLKSKFLRVIDLNGLYVEQFPSGIGTMIHLRYLGIRCKGFKKLPSSIGKLLNLQTLDIRKSSIESVPDSFWRIPTLRHILSDCVKLPKHIGELIHLQTLETADCINWNHSNCRLLENTSNIRLLKLTNLSTDQAEHIYRALDNLVFLKHLTLKVRACESIPIKIFSISGLRSLRSMELHGKLHDLQENQQVEVGTVVRYSMPNLNSITLESSQLRQREINFLSELPFLTQLHLIKCYSEESIEFRPNGFKKLKELELNGLSELMEWKEVTANVLPKLKRLILSGCTKLQSLPEGLEHLDLKEVIIYNMDQGIIEGIKGKNGENYEKIKKAAIRFRREF